MAAQPHFIVYWEQKALKITPTAIPDVLIIEPEVYEDERGFFMETYHEKRYREMGIDVSFVQDNFSFSIGGSLRGLHYQKPNSQAKIVYVLSGRIFDVAVDIRKNSKSYGNWTGKILSASNRRQLFIPTGFAHGYCVLSSSAVIFYKCSRYYSPKDEGGIIWNDPELNIDWPISNPIVSNKDKNLPNFRIAVSTLNE